MKKLIIITVLLFSNAAYADMVICQPLSDGRIVCTPAGGQTSIYRP